MLTPRSSFNHSLAVIAAALVDTIATIIGFLAVLDPAIFNHRAQYDLCKSP